MYRSSRIRLVVGTVLLLAPMRPVDGATAPASGAAPPVAFTVRLPAAVDAGSVAVTVAPDTDAERTLHNGESIDLLPITSGISLSSDRTLTVRVDPASLPGQYVEADGVSTFEVVALGDHGTSTWSKVVSPQAVNTPAGPAWTTSAEVPAGSSEPSARVPAGRQAWPATGDPVDPLVGGPLVRVSSRAGAARVAASTAAAAAGNCEGPVPRQTQVAQKIVWSTLGTTYPTSGSAATMQVDSSHGATYGIAVSGSGSFGSWNADGSRTITGGWGFKWAGSSSARSYLKQVEYRKYKYEYLDSRCDTYQWLPQAETGGTDEVVGISRPDFWTCSPESAGDWYRDRSDGQSYQLGTAVKFADAIGIDLSINRQYYSSQSLKYHIVGTHHYLCGSANAFPAVAGKLMERVID